MDVPVPRKMYSMSADVGEVFVRVILLTSESDGFGVEDGS